MLIFLLSFILLVLLSAPRGKEKCQEKEMKMGKLERELGKWNVLDPSNVSSKPRQVQAWEVDPQVDHTSAKGCADVFLLKGKIGSS